MLFSPKKKTALYGAMDVGADAIKAVIFEPAPEGERGRGSPDTASGLPRIREKFVWDLPISCSPMRLAKKIRESVFLMTEKAGAVPEKMLVALGPEVGEYALQSWTAPIPADTLLTGAAIRAAHRRFLDDHADARRAMIVAPLETLVNGYPYRGSGEERNVPVVFPSRRGNEIIFRTLALYLSVENGALFADLKKNLAGIATIFIPLVVAEQEAVARGLGMRDAFLVDVGDETTALVSVRDGALAHMAFMPCGIRRMAEIAAKKYRSSLRGARIMMRGYAAGAGRDEALAQAAAAEAAAEWKIHFVRALDAFYPIGPLAHTVLLTGGGARFREIRAAVEAPDWLGGFSYAEKPAVQVLDGAAFFNGNTLGGNLRGPEDAGLAALMIYPAHNHPQGF